MTGQLSGLTAWIKKVATECESTQTDKEQTHHLSINQVNPACQIINKDGLKSMFETSTLLVFWIKVMAKYPEIAVTALRTLLPFFAIASVRGRVYCNHSNQNQIIRQTGHKKHTSGVVVFHYTQMGLSCRETSSGLSMIQLHCELYFLCTLLLFCGASYFKGMFKHYIYSDQRVRGQGGCYSCCVDGHARRKLLIKLHVIVHSGFTFIIVFRKYHNFCVGHIILFCYLSATL